MAVVYAYNEPLSSQRSCSSDHHRYCINVTLQSTLEKAIRSKVIYSVTQPEPRSEQELLYHVIDLNDIRDNVKEFRRDDSFANPSVLLYVLGIENSELKVGIMDCLDLGEDYRVLGAQARLLRKLVTGSWTPLDDFVEYAQILCF